MNNPITCYYSIRDYGDKKMLIPMKVDYGEPGSEVRLKKIANVISSNCRNFKANDKLKYAYAINDYETDLKYLKNKYFIRGSFPWPESQ